MQAPQAPRATLDACVLANYWVSNLLLRLAESPGLPQPCWSEPILTEVRRVHRKLGWPDAIAETWQSAVRDAFPEAMHPIDHGLLGNLRVHPDDRHVLACAITAGSDVIVTFNLRDFPDRGLAPWGIRATHPDDLLVGLQRSYPSDVGATFAQIAARYPRGEALRRLMRDLPKLADSLKGRDSRRGA